MELALTPVRLALCGNVFPAHEPAAVLAAFRGPIQQWSAGLKQAGMEPPFAIGLYCSAVTAASFCQSAALRRELQQAMAAAEVFCWTANAFPFGDFHASRVKEAAFLPDWTRPERVHFTLQVAELLAQLAPAEETRLSISTCPLGYGPAALKTSAALQNLELAACGLQQLGEKYGKTFCLALEPEPDGALERVCDMASWLAESFPADCLTQLGVCWDLCHSAVVGESFSEILRVLEQTEIAVGKVQISSALALPGFFREGHRALLEDIAQDPYLHQVRAQNAEADSMAWSDVEIYLQEQDLRSTRDLRIHCHVPVSWDHYPKGFRGTSWREAVCACRVHGFRDYEIETYTLGVLPCELMHEQGVVDTMVAESLACRTVLELDTNLG